MQDCSTGSILFYSANTAAVINHAIGYLTNGGKIFIKAGTYTFTTTPINLGNGNFAAVGTTSVSGIELYGEGSSTILNAGTNMNGAVIGVLNANNWYIHDLQINGNRASQSGSGGAPPYLNGIWIINSANTTIEHCYVHDTKTVGIYLVSGNSDAILYNNVVNNNANGIQVGWSTNDLIQGNTVNGASDVGISISGSG